MIGGNSRAGFDEALKWAKERPETLEKLMDALLEASADYLARQIGAGAENIADFSLDSLGRRIAARRGLPPLDDSSPRKKAREPREAEISLHVPVIGFPRESDAPEDYRAYIVETGVDAVSLDTRFRSRFRANANCSP